MTHQAGCARTHDIGDDCHTGHIPFGDRGSVWFNLPATGPLFVTDIPEGARVTVHEFDTLLAEVIELRSTLPAIPAPRYA